MLSRPAGTRGAWHARRWSVLERLRLPGVGRGLPPPLAFDPQMILRCRLRLRSRGVIRFADCELNLDRIVLRRGGEEIRIEPQVFDVLAYLVQHRGTLVRKEELLDAIWGDRFVSESALTTRIKAVRQAVGDERQPSS